MLKTLIKRDGTKEPLIPSKLNGWSEWAEMHMKGRIEWSSAALAAVAKLPEVATTKELMAQLINELLDMRTYPAYMMAGRLYAVQYRKDIYGSITPPTVWQQHANLQAVGLMREFKYTREEYARIEAIINHDNDYYYPEYAIKFIREKYAIRNAVTGQVYETPQFVYMRMAMAIAESYPEHQRLYYVEKFYNAFSKKKLSAPTPNYLYLGTNHYGWASCCIYTEADDEESLAIGNYIAWKMTVNSAGLGSFMSTRTVGDPIAGGRVKHGGKYKYYDAKGKSTIANKQAARGGAGTTSFSAFDPEAIDIVQYRNPLMPADKQNRDLHFSMLCNAWFAMKVANNEDIFTFTEFSAPDLFDAFFSPDLKKFIELYEKYEKDESFPKKYVSARKLVLHSFGEAFDTGTAYLSFIDEMNRHTPFKISVDHRIHCSNLCVAPETKILTKEGYVEIQSKVGQFVDVWNGMEWSNVEIVKTGENQSLVHVATDSGYSLDCTPYHKFYIVDETAEGGQREVRAGELKAGDRLIKFDFPVVEGELNFNALREDMSKMKGHLWVPSAKYSVRARLMWLAQYLDIGGVARVDEDSQSLQVTSTEYSFLKDVQLLLTTLGVNSKLQETEAEHTNATSKWLLTIDSIDTQKLLELGLTTDRLHIEKLTVERSGSSFVRITGVSDFGRKDDTYCFTEPKRHMGVFNGMLTGQCQEIMEIQAPYFDMRDLYLEEDHGRGEIAMCNLAALPVDQLETEEEYAEAAELALRMIDHTILHSSYPFPHLAFTAKQRMNAGVGIMGLATVLARKGLRWDSIEGKKEIHRIFERHMYHLIMASIKISKERGVAPWIHKTKWPEGWTPLKTYNRNVDKIADFEYQYDWDEVSRLLIENGGLGHSVLCAMMPGESSSKALGSTNSVYPIRSGVIVKTDGDNNIIRWAAIDEDLLGDNYQSSWDISAKDLIECYAIMQKWCDQGISADMYRRFQKGETKVSEREVIEIFLLMVHYGLKSRYYTNTLRPKTPKITETKSLVPAVAQASATAETEAAPAAILDLDLLGSLTGVEATDAMLAQQDEYGENAKETCSGFCAL